MYEARPANEHHAKNKRRWLWFGAKAAGYAVVVVVIFGAGVGVGNGTIRLSSASKLNPNLPAQLDFTSVMQEYNELRAKYDGQVTETQLLDGLKSGLAQATGDPYTVYFNTAQAKSFNEQLTNTFSGIGAELGKDAQGNLIVVAPIDGTPASKAGLRAQDIIVGIDGKSTTGMSVDDAVSKIRGPKGTKVALHLVRDKTTDLTLTITRDNIKLPSVKHEILAGNIGYLRITEFSDDTADLAHQAAQDFVDHHVKGIILDLRADPGGLLTAAISVSSMWLPEGKTILVEKRGNQAISTELANGIAPLKGIKTAVLIDEGSASASEITAGALHDNGVATLFGVKSYGKGSVQDLVNLPGGDGTMLKVTIARWYRPNGQNIDKKGITPDNIVKISDADLKAGTDPQKQAALDFLTK